jgi:hypothetical protein
MRWLSSARYSDAGSGKHIAADRVFPGEKFMTRCPNNIAAHGSCPATKQLAQRQPWGCWRSMLKDPTRCRYVIAINEADNDARR